MPDVDADLTPIDRLERLHPIDGPWAGPFPPDDSIGDEVGRGRPHPGQKYRHGWIPMTPVALLPREAVDEEYGPELDSVDVGEECRIIAREQGVTVESDQGDDIAIHAAPSPHDAARWADAIDDRETFSRQYFSTAPYEGGVTVRFGDVELDLDDSEAADAAQGLRDMAYHVEDHGSAPDEADVDEPEGDETPLPDDVRSRPPCEFTVTRSEDLMFDTLRAAVAEPEAEVERAGDEPYGPSAQAHYADPGYQDDGKKRYPLDSEAHCRAAWSYINQADNARRYSPDELDRIKKKIKAALKEYGVDVDDTHRSAPVGAAEILRYDRMWDLDDIEILRGGDGRTVEAYAAVFDTPTEIKDQHGHYMEVISRSAFNRAISHGIDRVGFFYHHGMTLHGTPSELGSVPIGSPVDIRADGKGLRTVSRFNKSQLADGVLEAIRAGDIRGYSFRGRIFQSNPAKPARQVRGGELTTVTRTELGLTEYGPTPTPYYVGAGIVAVRSAQQVADAVAHLDEQARAELIRILARSTPMDPELDQLINATPTEGPGAEDPHPSVHSGRQLTDIARKIQRARILLESKDGNEATG